MKPIKFKAVKVKTRPVSLKFKTKSGKTVKFKATQAYEVKTEKKEICYHCGQKIDEKIWLKHTKKVLIKSGLPSLAKLLALTNNNEKN